MSKERCEQCVFWVAPRKADAGECHMAAPAVVSWRLDAIGRWPPVKATDWCGEFKAAAP